MKQAWKDPCFWLLLSAGPVVWLALWFFFKLPVTRALTLSLSSLLMAVLVYPVLEEIVFRGGLQGWLLEFPRLRYGTLGISLANISASAVFVAFHFINHTPMWALLVFVPSLVFGFARERYASLLPCMLLHGFYNAGFIGLFG